MEVKDVGIGPIKNANKRAVCSSEWMHFHYDGVFKPKTRALKDGTEVVEPNPPQYVTKFS